MTKRCPYVTSEITCSPVYSDYSTDEKELARCPHGGKTPLQGCHFRPLYENMSFTQKLNPESRRQLFETTLK